MADDDFSDIHDALGILPTSDLEEQASGRPAGRFLAGGAASALGITDAYNALRGNMTTEEAKNFALGALPGLIPGAKGEAAAAEDIPALIKGVYEAAWKEGKAPFSTVSDIIAQHAPGKSVYDFMDTPQSFGKWDNELTKKYGNWADISFAKGVNPSLSDSDIHNYLTKNPGGNIFELAGHPQPTATPNFQKFMSEPQDYSKRLQPIEDWQEQRAGDPTQHSTFDFDSVEQRERARGQGYNVDMPLYKGGHWNEYQESLLDPNKKSNERALFFSDDKDIAEKYSHLGTSPLQYVARADKPMEIDWKQATGLDGYNGSSMHDVIESARKKGADMLVVRGMYDMGGLQDQYIVLDPKIVRQPGAEFDPSKMDLAKLAAGIGGAGVIGKNALQGGDQQ